jgi:hypothetical protein
MRMCSCPLFITVTYVTCVRNASFVNAPSSYNCYK